MNNKLYTFDNTETYLYYERKNLVFKIFERTRNGGFKIEIYPQSVPSVEEDPEFKDKLKNVIRDFILSYYSRSTIVEDDRGCQSQFPIIKS